MNVTVSPQAEVWGDSVSVVCVAQLALRIVPTPTAVVSVAFCGCDRTTLNVLFGCSSAAPLI